MINIKEVLDNNECYKCGACISACPIDIISKTYNDVSGFYDINIKQEKCIKCKRCVNVCPTQFANNSNNKIGKHKKITLAFSADEKVRSESTSGGVVNSINRYLLDNKLVDYVVSVKQDINSSCGAKVMLVSESSELQNEPREFASRYISIPVCEVLKNYNKKKRYVFVGTPCQISGAKRIVGNSKNFIFLGIACSGAISYNATKLNIKFSNMNSKIKAIYYRGDGWPGKNTILFENGLIKEQNHLNSNFNIIFSTQILKNKACRNCKDQLAEESDLSFFDFWNDNEKKNEKIGHSGIVIRTDEGEKIYNQAITSNYILEEKKLEEKLVIESQGWILKLKKDIKEKKGILKMYYIIIDFIERTRLYKILPMKFYKLLSKVFYKIVKIY